MMSHTCGEVIVCCESKVQRTYEQVMAGEVETLDTANYLIGSRWKYKWSVRCISIYKIGRVISHNISLSQHELNVVEYWGVMIHKVVYDNKIWNLQDLIHSRFFNLSSLSSLQLHSTILSFFSLSLQEPLPNQRELIHYNATQA